MFNALTDKLSSAFRNLTGRGRITESNVQDAISQVRTALLEADVNYKVVKDFCESVTQKALGAEVIKSVQPGQMMVKIVNDELINLMGPVDNEIYYVSPGPTVILLAGLQGSGKTTTAGKLARYLESKGRKPLLVADDLQRPAAIDQLKTLGEQLNIPVYSESSKDAVMVARNGVKFAREKGRDTVVLDTAGRLHIDNELMTELKQVCNAVQPHQIYLVCDSMTGQDAVNSAKEFNEQLELDGVILTKLDGDARGGAALSVKAVTGKPIKFIGVGEKLDKLEEFHPDRMSSRILGMGDIVTLVEKAQEQVSEEEAQKMQEKMAKGTFTFDDFLKQMQMMRKMGGFKDVLKLIPGMGKAMSGFNIDDKEIARIEAVVHSMTRDERNDPDIINLSRRRRIARGSGMDIGIVNGLIKTFEQSRQMMRAMSGLGPRGKLQAMSQMGNMLEQGGGRMPGKIKMRSKRKKVERKPRPNKKKKR